MWRPLFGPLGDAPLAYCDWNTVDVGRDYLPADLIFPHYIGEQYLVTHHPSHRWYYLSGQRTNEFTFLKCWDSRDDVARCKFDQTDPLLNAVLAMITRCCPHILHRPKNATKCET